MMGMDKDVFGTTEFKVNDNRMFHNGTNYNDTGNIDLYIKLVAVTGEGGFASFGSTANNLSIETCISGSSWLIVPCFAGSGNNTTPPSGYCFEVHTWNICSTWETGGSGGWPYPPAGGGGGGTPGGGNNPCSPFGNSINGFVPVECNPGPGGNPWPPIPAVVQYLTSTLSLNPVQIDWLTHHLTEANEIRTYLQVNNGSTQITKDHLDKLIDDNSYFLFNSNHHDSGDSSKMWWADLVWLRQIHFAMPNEDVFNFYNDVAKPKNPKPLAEFENFCDGIKYITNLSVTDPQKRERMGYITLDGKFIYTTIGTANVTDLNLRISQGVTYYNYKINKGAPQLNYYGMIVRNGEYWIPVRTNIHNHIIGSNSIPIETDPSKSDGDAEAAESVQMNAGTDFRFFVIEAKTNGKYLNAAFNINNINYLILNNNITFNEICNGIY